jgi:lipopolysaccharide transport system ATP-binding protein
MSDTIIRVENLGKKYVILHDAKKRANTLRDAVMNGVRSLGQRLRRPLQTVDAGAREEFWALKDVNFDVKRGEVVGIIGRNGAGKSTLLKILSRITEPTTGRITIDGRVASLLEVGTGFHSELTGRENIYLNGAILGMTRTEITRKFDEIVAFAEVEKFIDTPVKHYSSGMYMRLAFGVAAHLEPEILIVDEVLAVGDSQFQKKCLGKMHEVAELGRTVFLVSHNMHVIKNLCTRGIRLHEGSIADMGTSETLVKNYINSNNSSPVKLSFDIQNAPATKTMRLIEVRVLNSRGENAAVVEIDKEIGVEFIFDVLTDVSRAYAAFWLKDGAGTEVLSSANAPYVTSTPDQFCGLPLKKGRYKTVCKIPENFLNAGHYMITPILGLDVANTQILLRDALTFEVADTSDMRTEYQSGWLGVVRPKLPWSTSCLNSIPV